MKKIYLFCLFYCLFFTFSSNAQAFGGKGSKQLSIGLGVSKYNTWYPENNKALKGNFKPISTQLSFKGEFGIAKYIGIGFSIGADFCLDPENGFYGDFLFYEKHFYSFNIPVGAFGNFHFLQLINDLTKKDFAKNLDVYVGVDFGAGPSFLFPRQNFKSYGKDRGYLLYGGPHVGIRYFTKEKLGVYAEVGYGYSFLNGGIIFKF